MVCVTASAPAVWAAKPDNNEFVLAIAQDAALQGISVESSDRVWVVGDRGVIWSTTDGGRNWKLHTSGTTANLYDVNVRDQIGIVVGGWVGASTRTSHGLVLITRDGGQSWQPAATDGIPRLRGVRALAAGWIAWGDFSLQHNTAIFTSADGNNWQPIPCPLNHVNTVAINVRGDLLAVDRIGNAAVIQPGATSSNSFSLTTPNAPVLAVYHTHDKWLALGSFGTLLESYDGQRWQAIATPLRKASLATCDWKTIAQVDQQLWVAGSPGSILLHSPDGGATWETQKTEHSLPINALAFADTNRGWAVGPFGNILATRDGGRSWFAQRKASSRAGCLAISSTIDEVPWPALVATSWDELVTTASISLQAKELEHAADFRVEPWTTLEALAPQVGIDSHQAWQLPARHELDFAQQKQQQELTINRLTVALRTWRPDVALVSGLSDTNSETMITLAVEQASSDKSFADELGLPKWQVRKTVAVTDRARAQFNESASRILKAPGLAIWDLMLPLGVTYETNRELISMRTMLDQSATRAATASLMGGIASSEQTRRNLKLQQLGNYQLIMGRVPRTTAIEQLTHSRALGLPLSEWQKQVDFVLQTVPPMEQPVWLTSLSAKLLGPVVREHRQLVLERLASSAYDCDEATIARLKLLQIVGSLEMQAWFQNCDRLRSNSTDPRGSAVQLASATRATPFDSAVVPASAEQPLINSVVTPSNPLRTPTETIAKTIALPTDSSSLNVQAAVGAIANEVASDNSDAARLQQVSKAFSTFDRFIKSDAALRGRPDLELMQHALIRRKAELQQGEIPRVSLDSIARRPQLAGWTQVARQELLLAANQLDQLRWVAFATRTNEPPMLDGQLTESMWNITPPAVLVSDERPQADEYSTKIRWCYDDQYLYIGIENPRVVAKSVAPKRVRSYDSDLRKLDHVQLLIDVDRDYFSAIELAVAEQGECYDRCCDISSYNPRWSIGVPEKASMNQWTTEIAIELKDLTPRTDVSGQAWAISARRETPDASPQSWSQLRSQKLLLQSAGLLLFVPQVEPTR